MANEFKGIGSRPAVVIGDYQMFVTITIQPDDVRSKDDHRARVPVEEAERILTELAKQDMKPVFEALKRI